MWDDTVWRVNGEKESRLLREAEQERLANIARQANKPKRSGYRIHLRQVKNRLWALRWWVAPGTPRAPRNTDMLDTEEFPCVAGYEC